MITAILRCNVYRGNSFSTKEVEVQVDSASIQTASTGSGKEKLSGWAMMFFPGYDRVVVLSLSKKR